MKSGKIFSIIFSKPVAVVMFLATLAIVSIPLADIPKNLWFLRPAPFLWFCLAVLYQVLFAVSKNRLRLLFFVSPVTGFVFLILSGSDKYENFPFAGHISNFFIMIAISSGVILLGLIFRLSGTPIVSKLKPLLPRRGINFPGFAAAAKIIAVTALVWYVTGLQININNLSSRLENIERRFGGIDQLRCSESDLEVILRQRVVRVVGGFGEGSGFPISQSEILTNYHVIDGEPIPKVVFPDGRAVRPHVIRGNRDRDAAILVIDNILEPLAIADPVSHPLVFGEPVYAAGYPLGSELPGGVSINKGSYVGKRFSKIYGMNFIQTDISVNQGGSGGPLVTACGQVVGMTTSGVAGLSLFLDIADVQKELTGISSTPVSAYEIDRSTPEGAVRAFYTFIKAGDLEKAYNLISETRRRSMDFKQWKQGYADTLQVDLVSAKPDGKDKRKVAVKIVSKDLVDGEIIKKYFQGYWLTEHTVSEADRGNDWEADRILLTDSRIKEIPAPGWLWFYEEVIDKLK